MDRRDAHRPQSGGGASGRLVAPASVSGTGGPISYNVTFGYSGTFTASPRGLLPAVTTAGSVGDDPNRLLYIRRGPGTVAFPVTIAAGTTHARSRCSTPTCHRRSDLDLYVTNSAGDAHRRQRLWDVELRRSIY